jgi:spectinomycin phosphotransferase
MPEPPALAEEAIAGALEAGFGVRVAGLVFLPVGNDAASWAYRVEVAGEPSWFLKVRAGAAAMPGAAVPAYLHRHGVPLVLAPLPTGRGAPFVVVDRFALALYPLLDAATGAEVGLSPAQWRELGAAARQAHTLPPTPELAALAGRETFRPSRRELLPALEAAVARAEAADPVAGALAGFWKAPRERDLMFVVGGIGHGLVRPHDTERFLQGYGETGIDPRLLAYYRTAWAVQDLAAYGEEVLLTPALGQETRRAALEGLMGLFEPGNIVDLANRFAGRFGPG